MIDPVIEAVESLPPDSCAPKVVSAIYGMADMSPEAQRSLSTVFMSAYRQLVKTPMPACRTVGS